MKCIRCKETYDDDFKFCPYCGERKPDPKICPICEIEHDIKFNFCTECGEELITKKEYEKKLEEIERERLEEERRLQEIERERLEEERRLEEIERKKEEERKKAEVDEIIRKLKQERKNKLLELIDNIFLDESSRNKVKNLIVDIDIYETDQIIEIVKEEEIKYRSEVDIELIAEEYCSRSGNIERWYKIENHIVEANCSRSGNIERWYESEGIVFVMHRARGGEIHMLKDEDFLRDYFKRRNEYLIENYK